MTTDLPEDPVEMVMRAIEHYDGLRSRLDPLKDIMDRERLLVAIILGMLSDPNHPVGKYLGRELLAAWIERGGKVPRPYYLSRGLLEPSQFDFTAQYPAAGNGGGVSENGKSSALSRWHSCASGWAIA